MADRKDAVCKPTRQARVETGLAFGNESDPCPAFVGVGYETSIYRGLAHLALLSSFPSVRMRENELDVVLDGFPYRSAISVAVDDEGPSAAEEVLEEVAKHLDR